MRATLRCLGATPAAPARGLGHARMRAGGGRSAATRSAPLRVAGVDKNRLRFLESPPAAAAAAGDVEVDDAETVEVEPIEVVDGREAVAHLRNLRGSPNKVRRVLDAIRGLSYEEALMALEFMPYRACDDILKVLYSAAANAKNNMGLNKSKLYISQCWCDPGKLLKRPRPRARGRADVVKKPGCHITMYVKERQ
mmetsp:Transcript_3644/g.9144  ORF Transcript_3644/g.9144 Transcript_3644/m.9144 type:complete len:195 (+) Transcript_3644:32-616(+)